MDSIKIYFFTFKSGKEYTDLTKLILSHCSSNSTHKSTSAVLSLSCLKAADVMIEIQKQLLIVLNKKTLLT
jgi:hypothetical protein